MAIEIKKIEELNNILEKEKNVVIDFYADWCGPCRVYSPIFNEVASIRKDVKMFSINTEENQEIPRLYDIRSIPTTMFFKNGKKVNIIKGYIDKEKLNKMIDDLVK